MKTSGDLFGLRLLKQNTHLLNSLTTMVTDMRPLFLELRDRLITFSLFVR
jgi:hypothetical protein